MSRLEDASEMGIEAKKPDLESLAQSLKTGQELTHEQHSALERLLKDAAQREPAMVAQVAFKQEIFSGPLPHPDQLNAYDDITRSSIIEMAVRAQLHAHSMQLKGLTGAILKDRLGQIFGFGIAISGLAASAWISQYSAVAAAIIGTLDLVGMVGVFVIPRAFERNAAKQPPQDEPQPQPQKKNRGSRKK